MGKPKRRSSSKGSMKGRGSKKRKSSGGDEPRLSIKIKGNCVLLDCEIIEINLRPENTQLPPTAYETDIVMIITHKAAIKIIARAIANFLLKIPNVRYSAPTLCTNGKT